MKFSKGRSAPARVGRPKKQLRISDAAICRDYLRVLLSKKQAALLLGLCSRSIDHLIARGELPSVKIGDRRLVPLAALFVLSARDHPVPIAPSRRRKNTTNGNGKPAGRRERVSQVVAAAGRRGSGNHRDVG